MTDSDEGQIHNSGRDIIIINCGGVRHETFRSTLRNFPDTRLAWSVESTRNNPDYDPGKNEFFFDRHPGVFAQIINFYRTGKLHAPHDVCGPLFQEELMYWGIDEKQMEPCCWTYYTQHREAQENLKFFEGADSSDDEGSDDEIRNYGGWENNIDHSSLWQKYKPKVWSMFENHRSSRMAKIFFFLSLGFIIVSVVAYCTQTIPAVQQSKPAYLSLTILELICGVWFTLEFTIRAVTCPSKREFVTSVVNWLDFIAILPLFVRLGEGYNEYPYDEPSDAYHYLASCRLIRLVRFFKVNLGFQILKQTLIASSRELLLLLLLLVVPVVIGASFAYTSERENNPLFRSVPECFWWALITITTVGYGDMAPKTTMGKITGSLVAGLSILITALPISIIGSNFSLYYAHAQAKMKLPKKVRGRLFGAPTVLMSQSARTSDDMSTDNAEEKHDHAENMNGGIGEDSNRLHNYRRARRARSSLYAGGVVPRMSLPARTRSIEDLNGGASSPPDDRKKSFTSTQTTTIDTPPKSPPHYGNSLTVEESEVSENILDLSCPEFGSNDRIVHNECEEFDLDDIDRAMAMVEETEKRPESYGSGGGGRPGTPVKKRTKHSVRFVKPTLTVTLDTDLGNANDSFVEEDPEAEHVGNADGGSNNRPQPKPPEKRPSSPSNNQVAPTGPGRGGR